MHDSTQMQTKLCTAALDAEEGGRLQDAAKLYRQAIACDDRVPTPYLFLGYVLQNLDRRDAAVQAWSFAADLDPRVVNAWRNENVAADIQRRSKCADNAIRRHFTALHKNTIAAYQREHPQANVDRITAAIWCQTHDTTFEYQHPRQKPHLFFVPDLAPIAVYGPEHMPWQAALETAFKDIREEFLAARESAADEERPYFEPGAADPGEDWKPIANSLNWGSFHLYKQGTANPRLLAMFPATLIALQSVPVLETTTGPREILFSVLQGGQRIPTHFGVANTDITVHMPIIATEESAIRVVDEVNVWQEGKIFAFDDAFDHESWNDGVEPRVNLLFEAWHPDLTVDERSAIAATIDARESWNRSRSI